MAELTRMHLRNSLVADCLFPCLHYGWSVALVDTGFIFMHKCFRTIAYADQREEKMRLTNILPKTVARSNCWDVDSAFLGCWLSWGGVSPFLWAAIYGIFQVLPFSPLIRGVTTIFLNTKCLSCFTICVTVGLQKHAGEYTKLDTEKRLC